MAVFLGEHVVQTAVKVLRAWHVSGAHRDPSLATLAIAVALLCGLIVYETIGYGEGRRRVRYAFDRGIEDVDA